MLTFITFCMMNSNTRKIIAYLILHVKLRDIMTRHIQACIHYPLGGYCYHRNSIYVIATPFFAISSIIQSWHPSFLISLKDIMCRVHNQSFSVGLLLIRLVWLANLINWIMFIAETKCSHQRYCESASNNILHWTNDMHAGHMENDSMFIG